MSAPGRITCIQFCSEFNYVSPESATLTDVIRKEHDRLVIHLHTDNSDKELAQLRKAITSVTTTLVVGDEWNFNPDLPDATASLKRLLGELVSDER